MSAQTARSNVRMEVIGIPGTQMTASRIALGTWTIGGWMWGGTDETQSIRTIHEAIERGITLIDTAPVYGFGRSEEVVGQALAVSGRRQQGAHCNQARPGLEGWQAVSQCQSGAHLPENRRLPAASADRRH